MPAPTAPTVLSVLTKDRLVELGRELGASVPSSAPKEQQIERLTATGLLDLPVLARLLRRDELKQVCRVHGLDDSGRSRSNLAARLLGGTVDPSVAATAAGASRPQPSARPALPGVGEVVQVRHRQYLVEEVVAAPLFDQATRVRLVCLDDDNQGRVLEVLWELELGARVLHDGATGLGTVRALDPPRSFAAYLHALRWNSVTATDARLFQAPFRAGIELMNHQLTPLKRALELPRANLFIADDVGLGKTIEAGLVLQELLLRQQVTLAVIVAPASVCLQWRDEMQKRFGLSFELYNRAFVARRRQERGFGVNPWMTHARFIISYQTLRRPEHRDLLLARLGDRARKSLLILDEAHTAAPASASKYAIDSQVTKVIRDLAARFDNRLFLSATPHNGHSNSFSALLELLDPQRFTRGVRPSPRALETVMVRRLKQDLKALGVDSFPSRRVIQLDVGTPDSAEVRLSRLLAEYTTLMKPARGQGKLVFISLQKRLLSSVEGFRRTLEVHQSALSAGRARTALQLDLSDAARETDDEYGDDDQATEDAAAIEAATASRSLTSPAGRAQELLETMRSLAAQSATGPDAKIAALVEWIQANQCSAARIGGAEGKGARLRWTDRRVIIFTEYGDTKRYLVQQLQVAIEGSHLSDQRIAQFHGGMSDEQREEIQQAFNGPPDQFPVRILVATDAAREGVNLQGHCADLFHFDVPWNPARMEQRNGRIDRTLQPAKEVRCHYFHYPDRTEDQVLKALVDKVETIQKELGSLGTVVMDQLSAVLAGGITSATAGQMDAAHAASDLAGTVKDELESQRELKRLKADVDDNAKISSGSRQVMDYDPALLRGVIDVGLSLAGAGPLEPAPDAAVPDAFALPALGDSWQVTLDSLRRPRARDEWLWDWRRAAPPQPVVFGPPPRLSSAVAQLHLSHPFVQRILARFRAQGFSAQDLSRATVLLNRHDDRIVTVAFGRLSLFGPGATRLHDQLVPIAAHWEDSGGAGHRRPLDGKAQTIAMDLLFRLLRELPSETKTVPRAVQDRLAAAAADDLTALWTHVRDEGDSLAHDARQKLQARARAESDALAKLIESQRTDIQKELARRSQMDLPFTEAEADQRGQFQSDIRHMTLRLSAIDRELQTEPAQVRSLYDVSLQRLEPVGIVYLWPATRT